MDTPIYIAKGDHELDLLLKMANRHGLIAGATGTGKTVTLQSLAQGFSDRGIPVFTVDVKGDLSGISQPGTPTPKWVERAKLLGWKDYKFEACPVIFWDIFGLQGHPIRSTVQKMGPLLISRMLSLNETQSGVLTVVFKVADEKSLPLVTLDDLQSLLHYVGNNATQFTTQYGNISTASIGAIQRSLLELDHQGGAKLFGEPALDLNDFLRTNSQGKGYINVLVADTLMQNPKMYASFLLWLLTSLYEKMPEVGDPDKPALVFFFDEAHLLFTDAPKALLDKIEQIIRLIRSKGVGVFFITQNPIDVPETVLGQLGNRVQHALRAFTPRDQKAVKAAADTFRSNPKLKIADVITQLGVGEALVSLLDNNGTPAIVERAFICPPLSQIGAITPEQRKAIIAASPIGARYDKVVEGTTAAEKVQEVKAESPSPTSPAAAGPVKIFFINAWKFINGSTFRSIIKGVITLLVASTKKKR